MKGENSLVAHRVERMVAKGEIRMGRLRKGPVVQVEPPI